MDTFGDGGSGNLYDATYPQQVGTASAPVTFSLVDYAPGGSAATIAATASEYYYVGGDIDGDYILANGDGLYYATGNINLDKTVTAAVTLVAEGFIEVSGSNQILTHYIDGLLAYGAQPYTGIDQCDKFVVSMGGSDNDWTGIIYGPEGLIEMNGSSSTTLTGSLIGFSVRLDGSSLTIIADPDLVPGAPYVRLTE